MIVKKRKKSTNLYQLEALSCRILNEHPKQKYIQENLNKALAGYKGELSIDYPLSFLQKDKYFILHDLRLNDGIHFFQIDTLILSKKFLLIIEVKNIIGTLYFDLEFNQLVRTIENKEEGLPDPLSQVYRQRLQLKNWLRKYNCSSLPIEVLVVVSNDRSVIKTSTSNLDSSKQIIHSSNISNKIDTLEKNYQLEKMTATDLSFLIKHLLNKHVPLTQSILKRYHIETSDLVKGVQCPNCSMIPMKRSYGSWVCETCGAKDKNAHIKAFIEYLLLIKNDISNKEAKDFLIVSSNDVIKRILPTISTEFVGKNKGRRYKLSFEHLNSLLGKDGE
ncbi:MAG: nuclease-related domain-containing protein [Bacillota bacterium]